MEGKSNKLRLLKERVIQLVNVVEENSTINQHSNNSTQLGEYSSRVGEPTVNNKLVDYYCNV